MDPWSCMWALSTCGEWGLLFSYMWTLPGLNSCALHWQVNSPWDHHGSPCPTLCYPMDCSPLGSSVHGIFHARILEWIAISTSRGSSQPRDHTHVSCISRQIFFFFLNHWANWETPQKGIRNTSDIMTPSKVIQFTSLMGNNYHASNFLAPLLLFMCPRKRKHGDLDYFCNTNA